MSTEYLCELCGCKSSKIFITRIKNVGVKKVCPKCWIKLLNEGKLVYGTACQLRQIIKEIVSEE